MEATRVCSIADCERLVKARGWCNRHYIRWCRYGDPLAVRVRSDIYRSIEQSFWSHVPTVRDPSRCWEWQGLRMVSGGYGSLCFAGVRRRAHRVSWELANGRPVPEGLLVLHSCDNPPCVNPAHLRAGTTQENSRDIALRARQRGERNGFHRLTLAEVYQIREARQSGVSNAEQARHYRVDPSTISRVITGDNWKGL